MQQKVLLALIAAMLCVAATAQVGLLYHPPALQSSGTPFATRIPAALSGIIEKSSGLPAYPRLSNLPQPLAIDAATRHLPFFCRQELAAEKRFGVPLRLRLGSVQYTDWLEQKPGAVAPR